MLKKLRIILSIGLCSGGMHLSAEELAPFRSLIDHSVRIAFLSGLSPSSHADLVRGIVAADKAGVVDDTKLGVEFENADALVFILRRWSDVSSLPGREYFLPYYNDVEAKMVSDVKRAYLTETISGRPILLIFYNLEGLPRATTKCLSEDIILELSSADLLYKTEHFPCK